jgi:hypothetical protein
MITLLLSAATLVSPVADAAPASAQQSTHQNEIQNLVPVAAPPGATLDITTGGSIALEVNEKKSELTLGYSWSRQSHQPLADNELRLYRNAFHVELSLPIGGKDNLLLGDTYRGLRNGPSISGSWTWFGSRARDDLDTPAFVDIMHLASDACPQHARDAAARAASADADAAEADRALASAANADELHSRQEHARDLRGVATTAHATATEMLANCNAHLDAAQNYRPNIQFAVEHSGLREEVINRSRLDPGYAVGVEWSVGMDRFDYRTPITLVEHSRTEPNFSVKTYFSYFPSDAMSMFTIAAEYKNAFEAQHDQILCPAVITNPNDDCQRAPPGPPRNSESLSASLEYRRVLGSLGRLGQVAIAPRASIDAISGEYELALPVYLRPRSDFGLLPGLSVTYNSKDDEVIFGVFLKRSFSF